MDIEAELIPKFPLIGKSRKKKEKIQEDRKELALGLLEAGRTYREVAEAMDMSIASVHRILKESPEKISSLVEEVKGRFISKHLLIADSLLNGISGYGVSLKDRVICAAILIDKAMQMQQSGLFKGENPSIEAQAVEAGIEPADTGQPDETNVTNVTNI